MRNTVYKIRAEMIPTSKKQYWLFLTALNLPVLFACMDVLAVGLILHNIGLSLNVNQSDLTWIMKAFFLANACTILIVGKLVDAYGAKKTYLIGFILFLISVFLASLAHSINLVIIARSIQGVDTAMMLTASTALINQQSEGKQRIHLLASFSIAVGLGIMLGPLFGGLLTQLLSWRAVFWMTGICSLTLIPLMLTYLPTIQEPQYKNAFKLSILLLSIVFILIAANFFFTSVTAKEYFLITTSLLILGYLAYFLKHHIQTELTSISHTGYRLTRYLAAGFSGFIS